MKARFSVCRPMLVTGLMAVVCSISSTAFAQLNSSSASVAINATLGESLTVSATPAALTFTLAPGTRATASSPVVITTAWTLSPSRSSVVLGGYFTSSGSALSDGGTPANTIPSADIFGQVTTGTPTAYTAFTQAGPAGPVDTGLILFSQALNGTNRTSSRTDSLNLQIDLTSIPTLPSGSYTGVLTLQAQAI
ncbi:hypothetical protein [Granulicella mallensis]|uniref:WxL domain-containing protein n=2 Tax=Granulicella mallensis TaxID=940614 RepID=G8P0E0_GRAMM|nr:hypothetical protein [Granulicella mallensis]AEU38028.1 hypothetical protein AciX8_3743 [Granulicella mallensis MP5ACTX8]MBB5066729.1 hypothetical protein [Granulicella mallensis]